MEGCRTKNETLSALNEAPGEKADGVEVRGRDRVAHADHLHQAVDD